MSDFLPLSSADTERSFLYSCSGSPKSHRKSHGEHYLPHKQTLANMHDARLETFFLRQLWRRKLFTDPIRVEEDFFPEKAKLSQSSDCVALSSDLKTSSRVSTNGQNLS